MQGPPSNPSNPRVFFEISMANPINGKMTVEGRIIMELFADTVPKTADNFRALCTGEKGGGQRLHYKNIPFHRIIPGFMCQGGDTTRMNGTGGASIYGDKFRDESFKGKAGRHFVGALSMANSGPHTNGSQFFLCTAACGHLNGVHVVFGKVVEGMDVVRKMEKQGSAGGKTRVRVVISNCGELKDNANNKQDQLASIKRLETTEVKIPAAAGQQQPPKKVHQEKENPLGFAAAKSKALAQSQALSQQKKPENSADTSKTEVKKQETTEAGDAEEPKSSEKLLARAVLFEKQAALFMKRAAMLRAKAGGVRREREDDDEEADE